MRVIYLDYFTFPDADIEFDFFLDVKRTCYDSFYPFQVLSKHGLEKLYCEPITTLYGGNGSGKTTALNVIAEKIGLKRDSIYNKSNFYKDYLDMCSWDELNNIPAQSRIITSDDVFDYMLNIRSFNEGIDNRREEIFVEFLDAKYSKVQIDSIQDYDLLKKTVNARRLTQSKFVRKAISITNINDIIGIEG